MSMLSLPFSLVKCSISYKSNFQRFYLASPLHTSNLSLTVRHCRKMGRPPCCDKSNVKRGIWTAEEDAKILAYVSRYGIGNWTMVPKKAGLNRCGKSCRLRWTNYLRPDLKHDGFTPQEEDTIINLHKAIGSRWSLIAKHLPGRTDNDVKNYWNTKLRKKLTKLGIDPVTHKPFSKILSDYGNINTLPSNITPVRSLNRDSNNTHNSSLPISELTAVTEPRMEQFQDSFVTNHNSWNFQTQFLGMTQENTQPVLFNDVTPASSSSSCSSYTVNQIQNSPFQVMPNSPFLWSDFLNGEPTISTDDMIQRKQEMSQYKFSSEIGNYGYDLAVNIVGETKTYSEACSSTVKSFVDALLDQDSQIRSEFPQLLNESFEY